MPHIHTHPNQHDMTVSAYILLRHNDSWRCMVHFHRKIDILMQIGGHIELDETPWQAMAHELQEESGFTLNELLVLQHSETLMTSAGNVYHPVPFTMNTHNVGQDHFHSDLCYAFVAYSEPKLNVHETESTDIRWLTITELEREVEKKNALIDVYEVYEALIRLVDSYALVPANVYSLAKPKQQMVEYKRGKIER